MKNNLIVLFTAFFLLPAASVTSSAMETINRELLEGLKVAREQTTLAGSRIWSNFEKAPFLMLLTLQDREVLLCHDKLVAGFRELGIDPITNCLLQTRPNVFQRNLLAAMPVINGISTIVMGTPESTNRTVLQWTNTIFHEHFHQYQSTFPDYYGRVKSLGLDNGDVTGMWMLNYDFPYESPSFNTAFSDAAKALRQAVLSQGGEVQDAVKTYLGERKKAQQSVSELDWRYLEFQLWVEGVARWTEMEMAIQTTVPAFKKEGMQLRERASMLLSELKPAVAKREVFYPFGAMEAMLLERCKPDWRLHYPKTLSLGDIINSINPGLCK